MEKFVCKNGVRIVLENIPTVRSVAIGVWTKTGSRNETTLNNGISHFIEHMFFKGTATRSAKDIAESFDSIGGQVNAFTSKEYTCYYAKVLDTHSEFALEVLADMFFNSTFAAEEMEKEKKVVYEEIKMYEDTPDDTVHDLLGRAAYNDHALGFPTLGLEEALASFTSQDLKDYIHNCYTPDNIVVSIAGNIDASFIKKVEAIFGSFTSDGTGCKATTPTFDFEKLYKQKDTEQAHLALGYQGLAAGHDDIYSLIIMNNILGSGMSSRLFQEVREQRGLAYSIFSYHASFTDTGIVAIYGGTGADQVDVLMETIQNTLQQFKATSITATELNNAKEQLKGNLMLSLESTNSRMTRNGKNELLLGKHRSLDDIVQSIDAVTTENVTNMIEQIFTDQHAAALIGPKNIF